MPAQTAEGTASADAASSGENSANRIGLSRDQYVAQTEDLRTHRTGQPGGTPHGPPTRIEPGEDAEVRRSLEMENSGAAILAEQGYLIQQNPTRAEVAQARLDAGDIGHPGKDPDYLSRDGCSTATRRSNPTRRYVGSGPRSKPKLTTARRSGSS